MSETKLVGLKKAVHDMRQAPKGYHCEIWAKRNGKKVVLWVSEYLTANSWTTGIEGWKRIESDVIRLREAGYSWTEAIRTAAEEVKE